MKPTWPLSSRGPGRRLAGPRQHRADLRGGPHRRHPLHRPGICRGQNLRELHQPQRGARRPLAVRVMRQAAAALAKAAAGSCIATSSPKTSCSRTRGSEGRRLRPGPVLRRGRSRDLTQVGITMGTPLYMSPEQVEGSRSTPAATSIRSASPASHAYGAPPFRGDTALSVAVQHLKTQPERLERCARSGSGFVPDRPQDAGQGCAGYASPRELLQDLRTLDAGPADDWWQQVDLVKGWPCRKVGPTPQSNWRR